MKQLELLEPPPKRRGGPASELARPPEKDGHPCEEVNAEPEDFKGLLALIIRRWAERPGGISGTD